ncbi:Gas vesicle protein [Enterobacter asburiae]|uniref:hypothetical protein n=1 Tax=Enterobacter cloacae complex TaxID=354276 RepID=UPI0007DBF056|nr:hypothetical protein [Enterobacter hormaechei]ELA0937279.1 hypothetical protein [Klebsiella aerogenes]OAR71569.1 hypothetical protein AYO00_09385 [Enterobacter hormaechei]HBY9813858.1 hypothetical protein [Klebsiella aerogenes]HBY9823877.1 hypothetical protein [Klebsiella aerogenes]HCU2397121.1 hypothetical protein [Enterobacter hormaechei]
MEQEEKLQEVISYPQNMKDSALSHLVLCANLNAAVDVTLIIGGQVVAGQLVSGKEYAETMAGNLRSANASEDLKDAMASFFDSLAQEYRNEEGHSIPLNFLHIRNPAYLRGDGGWTNVQGTIVRIPIEKVSGFSLGKDSQL